MIYFNLYNFNYEKLLKTAKYYSYINDFFIFFEIIKNIYFFDLNI